MVAFGNAEGIGSSRLRRLSRGVGDMAAGLRIAMKNTIIIKSFISDSSRIIIHVFELARSVRTLISAPYLIIYASYHISYACSHYHVRL